MEIAGKRVIDATKPVTIKITPRDVHVAKIKRHEVSGIRPKGANR